MLNSVLNFFSFSGEENTEPDAKRQRKPSKILDGTFFTIIKTTGDAIEASCCECNELKKGNLYSTGNFISHYKSKHAARLDELKNYSKKTDKSDEQKNTKKDRQPSISESFQNTTGETVRNIFHL